MKKSHLIITVLATAIMVGSVPLHAREGRISRARRIVKEKVSAAKEKATKQLDESLDRFKRCIKLQCTRWEALKAARDVTIAAAAVIAAMYGTGTVLQMPERRKLWKYKEPTETEKAMYGAGILLKRPGKEIGKAAAKVGRPIAAKLGAIEEEEEEKWY